MSYAAGQTILDDEYNDFAVGAASGTPTHTTRNIDSVWGSGTNNKGYGQSTTLGSVSAGSSITATQWDNMIDRLASIAAHNGTSVTGHSAITAGNTISIISALNTDITNTYANRGNASASGADNTASDTQTSTWNGVVTATATANFGTDAEARYFFNAGGLLNMDFSTAAGSGAKDTGWANLCAAAGPVWLSSAGTGGPATSVTIAGTAYTGVDHKGTGSPNTETNTGFFGLTSSNQQLFMQSDSTYLYTANDIRINYKYNGSGLVTMTVTFNDEANTTGHTGGTADPSVTIDITATIRARQPSTTNISNTWGGAPVLSVTGLA